MADIDEVLERLVADGDFRAALARDPAAALADYDLTRDDIELLASRLDDGDAAERTVEQRTSKSAMLALLASFAGPGGGGAAGPRHEDQIEVLSWSWGETQGGDAAPDGLAVPDDGADELYHKNGSIVQYDTTYPDDTSTDDEGIIINGLEEDGSAEMENVDLTYGKIELEEEPPDLTLTDTGDEPEEGVETFVKVEDIKGEVPDSAASLPGDDGGDEGIIIVGGKPEAAEVDEVSWSWGETSDGAAATPPDDGAVGGTPPDDGEVGGIPPDDSIVGGTTPDDSIEGVAPPDNGVVGSVPPDDSLVGAIPPDDNVVGGNPPDDGVVGAIPPDDSLVGSNPPDDGLVGANPPDDSLEGVAPPDNGVVGSVPPDDNLMGSNPPDDNLGARTDVTAAMDGDDVMEIEDV